MHWFKTLLFLKNNSNSEHFSFFVLNFLHPTTATNFPRIFRLKGLALKGLSTAYSDKTLSYMFDRVLKDVSRETTANTP